MRGNFSADHAAATAAIVDDHLDTEHFSQLVDDDARDRVVRAACRIRRNQANWMCRVILARCAVRIRACCKHDERRRKLNPQSSLLNPQVSSGSRMVWPVAAARSMAIVVSSV